LGSHGTDKFVWLQKEDLDMIQVDGEVRLKFKPLEVRYLLALIDWINVLKSLLAWTGLEQQDFSDWRRHLPPGTPV
jgi:hypothetical protein